MLMLWWVDFRSWDISRNTVLLRENEKKGHLLPSSTKSTHQIWLLIKQDIFKEVIQKENTNMNVVLRLTE